MFAQIIFYRKIADKTSRNFKIHVEYSLHFRSNYGIMLKPPV